MLKSQTIYLVEIACSKSNLDTRKNANIVCVIRHCLQHDRVLLSYQWRCTLHHYTVIIVDAADMETAYNTWIL